MLPIIEKTRKKFTILVLLAMFAISAMIYFGLQYASVSQIRTPISTTELQEHIKDNDELRAYVESQKEYEAHFITLANKIRSEDSRRISEMVAIITVASLAGGSIIAFILVRTLMKPVTEAYRSQERFLQDAAHELRNPLATLTVAIQQYNDGSNATRLVDTFRRQTKRLVSITEDLLFLERKARGEAEICDVSELLEDVVEELKPFAKSAKVSLRVSSDKIMKKIVIADYVRMVKNIIDNSIKYSHPSSTVVVTQRLHKTYFGIVVKDTGIGIPKEQLGDIGKRFFRANNVGTRDGTGLGIAIVQRLVNLYGGKMSIESSAQGTTVSIRLPKS